jgi:hypothetical protein
MQSEVFTLGDGSLQTRRGKSSHPLREITCRSNLHKILKIVKLSESM